MSQNTINLLSALAAILPTLLYVSLIYWVDRYEKEPWWLLAAAFLWGAIPSILIAYVFNSLLAIPFYWLAGEATGEILAASFIAPPVEETLKGIALLGIFFWWRQEIDSPLDGIIYGAMVGMGFAMVENVYYFLNIYHQEGLSAWEVNIFVRAILFGLNHALFSSMTGLGIAIARLSNKPFTRWVAPFIGWAAAMSFHFLHNFTVSSGTLLCLLAFVFDWGGVTLTLLIIIWSLWQENRWIAQFLKEEVDQGILTVSQYELACSPRRRNGFCLQLLLTEGVTSFRRAKQFFYRCAELAYKKHHYELFGDAQTAQLIATLRQEIARFGQ